MICRFLTACFLASSLLTVAQPASAASTGSNGRTMSSVMRSRAAYRQAIRRFPLLARPDRPGHFYGNTVRRIYRQRAHGH